MVVMSTPLLGVTADESLPLSFSPFNAGAPIVANASLLDLFVYDVPSFDVVISSASFAFSILGIVANLLEKMCSDTILKKKSYKIGTMAE